MHYLSYAHSERTHYGAHVSANAHCRRFNNRAQKPYKGMSSMGDPKIWFNYEQQVQQIYRIIATHVTVSHTLQRRTSRLSFIVTSNTWQPRCCFTHTQTEKHQWRKWFAIPTLRNRLIISTMSDCWVHHRDHEGALAHNKWYCVCRLKLPEM